MMGQQSAAQEQLFYEFSIESHVPADHLLRRIDRILDLTDLRHHLAPFYSHTGRPSIDPELMIRMLIVGYCFAIRSERRLCEEVHLNLAYRWFCRLGLEQPVPEHSTFSKNRHGRFRDSGTFRWLFDEVLRRINASEQYQRSRKQRKKVEMLFAHLKRILRLDRLRLRGLSGAFDEFTLAGLASATQFATFYPTLRNSDRPGSDFS
jgi:transposase